LKDEENIEQGATESSAKANKAFQSVAEVVSGRFLSNESMLNNFPFIFFLSLLAICYIGYGYYSDDQVRRVNTLSSELKDLKTRYIVIKDSLVLKSKQTEVSSALANTGIQESIVPPKKISVKTIPHEQ
jgi:Bacteriodetes cell division protein (FtsL-like)